MGKPVVYRLLRPLVFLLDPERAHNIAMGAARQVARFPLVAGAVRRCLARPRPSPVRVAGLDFPNPIGLAAGFDKNAEALLTWWACGFGFVEIGTVTPKPQVGNERPRLFRYGDSRALVNRMGFNNEGAVAIAARLARQKADKVRPPFPIGISLGKNATTARENAAEDYATAAAALAPYADFLVVNVSSPNTANLRDLQEPEGLLPILRSVAAAAGQILIFVKLAPELDGRALIRTVQTGLDESVAGFIATNTLRIQGQPEFAEGGLSGGPLHELAVRRVAQIRSLVRRAAAIIGCGGITDSACARRMFDAGADLIQLYTGLVFEGPFLPARLSRSFEPTNRVS